MSSVSGDLRVKLAQRIDRLQLPERAAQLGISVGAAERELTKWPSGGEVLNATYADTHHFPPPSWVLDEFLASAAGGGETYTPYRGDAGVRRALAPRLSHLLGVSVDPESELVLTAGTQGALFSALSALIEPGDRVVLVDPDYLTNERTIRYLGGQIDHVRLLWDDGEPTIDLAAVENALARGARLVLFSHPNNPTGAVFRPELIAELAMLVRSSEALVLVDQLYSRLIYDERPFAHLIAEPGMKERCLTTLGPSKTESMSGYRLGAIVAPSLVASAIEDIVGISTLRAPAYAQRILRRWMADDHDFIQQRIADCQLLRDMTVARLNAQGGIHVEVPGGSAYAFVDVSSLSVPDQEIARRLLDAKIVVNPGYQFGPNGVGSFRVCFAQEEGRWNIALERICDVINELQGSRSLAPSQSSQQEG